MSSGIKSFVSEKQLEEKRRVRQEEWERVRKPEDPVQAPEEAYDNRSLYERLKEQQDKKQEEFEEKLKFKNQFRGIDEDESNFLQEVHKRNFELEKRKKDEEKRELEDFRNSVIEAKELDTEQGKNDNSTEEDASSKKVQSTKKNKQQSILKGAVKRKAQFDEESQNQIEKEASTNSKTAKTETYSKETTIIYPSVTKCIGILPGLAEYSDSGDSDDDDDSSSDGSDLITGNLLSRIVHNSDN